VSAVPQSRLRARADRRILHAARHLVQRGGVAELSIGDVATEAGVSKALVLYHFGDRDSLLAALVEDIGGDVIARAQAALARDDIAPLDAHWAWLEREVNEGDVRALVSLAQCHTPKTVAASRRMDDSRRRLMVEQVEQLFQRLALRPKLPAALVAETVLAFADGLACRAVSSATSAASATIDPRGAFDVMWLALLTLHE
jgi:AcrR family transcriptional regulator